MKCLSCGAEFAVGEESCSECDTAPSEQNKKSRSKGGVITTRAGCLIGLSPFLVIIGSIIASPFTKDPQPVGVTPYFFAISIPIGGLIFIVGLFIRSSNRASRKSQKDFPTKL